MYNIFVLSESILIILMQLYNFIFINETNNKTCISNILVMISLILSIILLFYSIKEIIKNKYINKDTIYDEIVKNVDKNDIYSSILGNINKYVNIYIDNERMIKLKNLYCEVYSEDRLNTASLLFSVVALFMSFITMFCRHGDTFNEIIIYIAGLISAILILVIYICININYNKFLYKEYVKAILKFEFKM